MANGKICRIVPMILLEPLDCTDEFYQLVRIDRIDPAMPEPTREPNRFIFI
uniref:Uncharacterized protein n=1 Tax=Acrobeloides nanus TaxID=290746 RepID=A0A914D7F3_9BILA